MIMAKILNQTDVITIESQGYIVFPENHKLLPYLNEFFGRSMYNDYGSFVFEGIGSNKEYIEPITGQIMYIPFGDKFRNEECDILRGEDLGSVFGIKSKENPKHLEFFLNKFDILYYRSTHERFSIIYTDKILPELKKAHWMFFSQIEN